MSMCKPYVLPPLSEIPTRLETIRTQAREIARLKRRVDDLEDFLNGAAKQFNEVARK